MFFRKDAVLVIHGFAGGVYDQEDLINYLQLNKKLDVFSFTLPGHERNLSKVKYEQWIQACEDKIQWLKENNYKTIYVIGHSMGGVIASYLATKYKIIKKVVLVAPSFEYLQVKQDNLNIIKNVKHSKDIIQNYSLEEVFSRIIKLNISALQEFRKLVEAYHDCPSNIDIPIMILHGTIDKVVPQSACEFVYKTVKSKNKRLILVTDATHDIFRSKKTLEICKRIEKFLTLNIIGCKKIQM